MSQQFRQAVEEIIIKDRRYKYDAYHFVMDALAYTQKAVKSERHVSSEQILKGMKNLLLEKYGPLAMTVLKYWGVASTEDFGNIVFNLVENKVLTKTEDDQIEHFQGAYDFEKVFNHGYRKKLAKEISRMR